MFSLMTKPKQADLDKTLARLGCIHCIRQMQTRSGLTKRRLDWDDCVTTRIPTCN